LGCALALLPCFLFAAVRVAAAPVSAAAGHEYRITGTAVSTRDGSPVPYCRITANQVPANQIGARASQSMNGRAGAGRGAAPTGMRGGGGSNQPIEATGDASGKFTLELPHAGAWRLTATARGFRGQTYDEHENFYSAVVLTEAAPAFALTFRMAPDSVLDGLIFDEAGEPVAQAQVTAELIPPPVPGTLAGNSRPRPVGFGQTDDRGRYEIGGLAPGEYRLRVQAHPWYAVGAQMQGPRPIVLNGNLAAAATPPVPPPDPSLDLIYPVTWFPGVDDELAAETIKLGSGEERQADFHLTAIPAVHLKIPRPDNPATVPGRQDGQGPGRGNMGQQQRGPTVTRMSGDSQGQMNMGAGFSGTEWDVGGLAPGTYEVRIPGGQGQPEIVRLIEINPGSSAAITMEGAKPLTKVAIKIEGVADFEAPMVEFVDTETGARFTSNLHGGRGGFPGNRGGDEVLEDAPPSGRSVSLPPHAYEVYLSGNSGDYLTGIEATGAKVSGRVVTVSGDATVTLHVANTHAQLDGAATIDGKPAQGAMVLLVPVTLGTPGDLNAVQRDETNTDGTFLISTITPGRYILLAIDHGWDVDWRRPETLAQYLVHGTPVELKADAKEHVELEAVEP
jgi:hypothetical protein